MKNKLFTFSLLLFWGFNPSFFSAQNPVLLEIEQPLLLDAGSNYSPSAQDRLSYFYNHTEVICDLTNLEGFSFNMGPTVLTHPWSGCEHCCAFDGPHWILFSGGKTDDNSSSFDIEILVYPNPTSGILYIDLSNGQKGEFFQIQIFNRWGQQLVFLKGAKDIVEMNLDHLIPGIYILRVVGDQGTFFKPKSVIIHQ